MQNVPHRKVGAIGGSDAILDRLQSRYRDHHGRERGGCRIFLIKRSRTTGWWFDYPTPPAAV
jgi:hypothetical protein